MRDFESHSKDKIRKAASSRLRHSYDQVPSSRRQRPRARGFSRPKDEPAPGSAPKYQPWRSQWHDEYPNFGPVTAKEKEDSRVLYERDQKEMNRRRSLAGGRFINLDTPRFNMEFGSGGDVGVFPTSTPVPGIWVDKSNNVVGKAYDEYAPIEWSDFPHQYMPPPAELINPFSDPEWYWRFAQGKEPRTMGPQVRAR